MEKHLPPKDTFELLLKQVSKDEQGPETAMTKLRKKLSVGFCCPNQQKMYLSFLGPPQEFILSSKAQEWNNVVLHVEETTRDLFAHDSGSNPSESTLNSIQDKKSIAKSLLKSKEKTKDSAEKDSKAKVKETKDAHEKVDAMDIGETETQGQNNKKRKFEAYEFPTLSNDKWTEIVF